MLNTLKKYKNHRLAKYIVILLVIFIIYLASLIFIWTKTQSTDNAYIDADISQVSSEINGVIISVLVTDNMLVKKGDLIAQIDDADYKSKLAALDASINASRENIKIIDQKLLMAQVSLEQSQDSLDFANTNLNIVSVDYGRTKELNKENFASNKILDNSRTNYEKAKFDYNQSKLKLQIAQQDILLLNLQKAAEEEALDALVQNRKIAARSLENTQIIAPIDGILANSSLQIGNFISSGRILFYIVQNEKSYVQANFKETQINKFRPGLRVKLQFDSFPKEIIYGRIRNISPATGSKFSLLPPENATGNFTKIVQRVPILIDFEPNKNKKLHNNLMPGMSVYVSIRTDQEIIKE